MKTLKIIAATVLFIGLILSTVSCVVLSNNDNGKHKGWLMNSNNPHHYLSTNPGHGKGKSNK